MSTSRAGRRRITLLLSLALVLASAGAAAGPPAAAPARAAVQPSKAQTLKAYANLPLSFVPNEGQTDAGIAYYAETSGLRVAFGRSEATLGFVEGRQGTVLSLRFPGANRGVTPQARQRGAGDWTGMRGEGAFRAPHGPKASFTLDYSFD
jgi:hypothetical protein